MIEQANSEASQAHLVEEDGAPTYVRYDAAPHVGPAGLSIWVNLCPTVPAAAEDRPQVALAHAEHAAGWSLGLNGRGRASLTVGTRSGPVALRLGEPLEAEQWYEFFARIPGNPAEEMELTVRRRAADGPGEELRGSVRIAAPVLNSNAPLLWGCRSLFDGKRPEFPFLGRVSDVLIVADSRAPSSRDDVTGGPGSTMRWEDEYLVG